MQRGKPNTTILRKLVDEHRAMSAYGTKGQVDLLLVSVSTTGTGDIARR
jgi:hypothetical protein